MSEPIPSVPIVPFSYTSRDYESLRRLLIEQVRSRIPGWTGYSDPADFGLALIESFAYAVDGLHYYLDRIANESYVATAVRPESIRSAARLVGYRPARSSNATVTLRFTNGTGDPITVPQGSRVQTSTVNDVTMSPVFFETIGEIQVPAASYAEVQAVEGLTFKGDDGKGEILGVSNGYSWMSYTLPRSPVVHGFVRVIIAYSDTWSEEWTQVEDIRASAASDKVFQVEQFPGQPVRIRFGNGGSGLIPPQGALIKVIYRVGGGTVGNVGSNTITVISDDVSLAGLYVTNPTPAIGGAEEESVESIRANLQLPTLGSTERASSLSDFERIARSATGVGKVKAFAYEESDVLVAVAPVNDGSLRPGVIQLDPLDPEDIMLAPEFSSQVMPTVRKLLVDSAYAGAQIQVIPPKYVRLYLRITLTTTYELTDAAQAELKERIKIAFSYPNVEFNQEITLFQIQRLFAGVPNLVDVDITRFNRISAVSTVAGTVSMDIDEIPWIDPEDPDLVTFNT